MPRMFQESGAPAPLVVILGPMGSGKSLLAGRDAKAFGGEIVNCDSLQLYRGFDIGTAKTPPAKRGAIPHHLFAVLSPQNGYSAGEYARAGREVLQEIAARGRLPVVVGGTGFYLKALLEGLPPLPEKDAELREKLAAREAARPGSLHRLLRKLDAHAASRMHANDVQKVIRALEVRVLTRGAVPSSETSAALAGFRVLKIGLDPERAELALALDTRTREMFQAGLIEEVRGLLASGCTGAEKPFES